MKVQSNHVVIALLAVIAFLLWNDSRNDRYFLHDGTVIFDKRTGLIIETYVGGYDLLEYDWRKRTATIRKVEQVEEPKP